VGSGARTGPGARKELAVGDLEALVERWLEVCASGATHRGQRSPRHRDRDRGGSPVGRDDLPPAEVRAQAPELPRHERPRPGRASGGPGLGADYAGLGAFYDSRTKPEAVVLDPRGAGLLEPSPGLRIPVLAIGGITVERVPDVLSIPVVSGIAVGAAVQGADDPAEAVARLRTSLDAAWASRPEPTPQEADGPARRAG
jgi:thiamine-phosphate pyrophosphorylase